VFLWILPIERRDAAERATELIVVKYFSLIFLLSFWFCSVVFGFVLGRTLGGTVITPGSRYLTAGYYTRSKLFHFFF